jgi:hypothetical protein
VPLVAARDSALVVVEEGADRNGGTDERILRRLAPGTPTVAKTTFALTGSAEAVERIAATAHGTLVVIGFETDTCVAQSGVVLRDLGYRVVFPRDATYSTNDVEHERGLDRLRDAGAEIHSCKGVTFEWLEHVPVAMDVFPRARQDFDVLPWRL